MAGQELAFFLGGCDLEMITIRALLDGHVPHDRVHDQNLDWGASVDSYSGELRLALENELTPVLIELRDADAWNQQVGNRCVVVDHHDRRSGLDRPSSLRQVFDLLECPVDAWTRWFELVDANDKGHVHALQAVGASMDEMREVRARDRAAQGITPLEEEQARRAAQQAKVVLNGHLTLVEIPHDRTSPVADALDEVLGGPGFENLLILGKTGRHFFGKGSAVTQLKQRFGGWSGGMLPERGFWGVDQTVPVDILLETLDGDSVLL